MILPSDHYNHHHGLNKVAAKLKNKVIINITKQWYISELGLNTVSKVLDRIGIIKLISLSESKRQMILLTIHFMMILISIELF